MYVYIEVYNKLLDLILTDFEENEQFITTAEIAKKYGIGSSTTVQKIISLLTSNGFLYKKRGIGMFVCKGAKQKIKQAKLDELKNQVDKLIAQAKKLGILKQEVILAINERSN